MADFYPRPPRGGRRGLLHPARHIQAISIHALREEGDIPEVLEIIKRSEFLSTPSARRATEDLLQRGRVRRISIHALREEGDRTSSKTTFWRANFYPRPPRGGRHIQQTPPARIPAISIHALREEGDAVRRRRISEGGHFYPRPPRGGRPRAITSVPVDCAFLSTPSARRATSKSLSRSHNSFISIHALCEEGDHDAGGTPQE